MPSRSRISSAALRLLAMDNPKAPPVNVVQLIELVGATMRTGELPEDLSGFLIREGDSSIIGVNSLHPETRQRFTMAHELGHLMLHSGASFIDRAFPVFRRDTKSSTAEVRMEIEANQFAADLLMPRHLLEPLVGNGVDIDDKSAIARLAKKFVVSEQAMLFRLTNLGAIAEKPAKGSRQVS